MKTYFLPLSVLLLLAFFYSCRKYNTPPQVDLGHFSLDTIKPYLYFKPGSWWVYKNDSTGEIDSQVMIASELKTVSASSSKRKYTFEVINTVAKSMTNNYFYDLTGRTPNPDIVNFNFGELWERSRHKSGDFDGINSIFKVPFVLNKDFGSASERCFYRGKLPTLTLNGFTFYEVLKFEVQGDASWPDSKIPTFDNGTSTYYWAKNVGLVMIENGDADRRYNPAKPIIQKWELINYHIEP